jgi:MYXO-CTERM domain-containing protein
MSLRRSSRFFTTLLAAGLASAAIGTLSGNAEAQVLRFSKTAAGAIASTGNTLGLSKAQNSNGPGVSNSIGTFISLDPMSVDDSPAPVSGGTPWGKGTTNDWTVNGSTGVLAIPDGAEILYAELVWAGSYAYGGIDLTDKLDLPVALSANADSIAVDPDTVTAVTVKEKSAMGFDVNYYMRSGVVTDFVQKHRGATYSVTGVPATEATTVNSLNAAGWQLVVAYRYSKLPVLRNLSIFVGGSFVDEETQQDYTLNGFCAPSSGPVEGRVTIAALEGDADLTGDELLIGASPNGTFVSLSGPNNPATNFFCSQINGNDGLIDVKGSFGDANHDALAGKNVVGGRQGWDTTTLPLSDKDGHLSNDQTSAVIRTITTGDSYMPTMVALELDVKSPDFTSSETKADKPEVKVGQQVEVTAKLSNIGEAYASAVLFRMGKIQGLELVDFKANGKPGDQDGKPVSYDQLPVGVPVGQLGVMESHTVTLTFEVVGPPADGKEYAIAPEWDHSFVPCAGAKPINDSHKPEGTVVAYIEETPDPTTTGGGGGSAPVPPPLPPIQEESSCGCSVPGAAAPSGGLAAVAAVAAFFARRRRSR